jgi:hypothetical protein
VREPVRALGREPVPVLRQPEPRQEPVPELRGPELRQEPERALRQPEPQQELREPQPAASPARQRGWMWPEPVRASGLRGLRQALKEPAIGHRR